MKYVAIYDLGGVGAAFCFDTYNSAVNYINTCSKYAGQYMIKVAHVYDNYYEMILKNGRRIYIHIEEHPDSKVRFDLSFEEDGKHIETRRFTKRNLAVDYANKILKNKYDYSTNKEENELGEWLLEDSKNKSKVHVKLNLAIIDKIKITGADYEILGIDSAASLNKTKRAYRAQAIKYHPDKGGDPEMFKLVHEAYERIMNGRAATTSTKQVVKLFDNANMRFVFKNFKSMRNRLNSILSTDSDVVFKQMRRKGIRMSVCGLVLMAIGVMIALLPSEIVILSKNSFILVTVLVGLFILAKGLSYFMDAKRYMDIVP